MKKKGLPYNYLSAPAPMVVLISMSMLLFIAGCEKDFPLDRKQTQPHLVVNSEIDNQRTMKIFLTQTSDITGSSHLQTLDNATIELYENDSLILNMPYRPADSANTFGSYQTDFFPTLGQRYSIKILHPLFGVITATDTLPLLADVQHYGIVSIADSPVLSRVDYDIQFHDDGSKNDFYRINIWLEGQQWITTTSGDSMLIDYGKGSDPEMTVPLADTVRDEYIIFSDRSFNGTNEDLKFWFPVPDTSSFEHLKITVELQHVSHAHYEYYRTVALSRVGGAESPVKVYSNINNGYGIFMAAAIYSMQTVLK